MPDISASVRRMLVILVTVVLPVLTLSAPASADRGTAVRVSPPATGAPQVSLAERRGQVRASLLSPRGVRFTAKTGLPGGHAIPAKLGVAGIGGRRKAAARDALLSRRAVTVGGPAAAFRIWRAGGPVAAAVPAADTDVSGEPLDMVVTGPGGPVTWFNEKQGDPLPAGMPVTKGLDQTDDLVAPGEVLTAYADVYNSDDLCTAVGGVETCPNVNHLIEMSWEVQCNGHDEDFADTQLLSAPSDFATVTDPSLVGTLASFQFQVDPALCAQGTPPSSYTDGNQNFFVTAQATVTDVPGDTSPTGELPGEGFEADLPLSERTGCPVLGNNADVVDEQALCADPVDTSTGNYSGGFTDATTQSPGYPLAVSRAYSSALTASGPLGNGWTMPWLASLAVNSSTGDVTFNSENGSQYVYLSNGDGTFSAPLGARSVLAKTTSGGYTLTTVGQDVLSFTSAGQLTFEDDATGRGLSFTYTGSQLTSVEDAAGQQATLAYTTGLLTKITLPDGHAITYAYTSGQLTSVTTPGGTSGQTTTYAYTSGLLTSIKDPDGHFQARNTYNSSGQVTSQEDGTGALTKFSYTTTSGGLPETDVTFPNGGITSEVYAGGLLLESVSPLGATTSYTYNRLLEPAQVTDPLGHVTTMTYDGNGNLASQTDPLGNLQQWTYDSRNNPTQYVAPDGNATTYVYSSMDEPTSVTTPSGKATYVYNAAGSPTSSVSPRGNAPGAMAANFTTSYTYNAAGQLASAQNPDGGVTAMTYDSMGSPLKVTDPLSRATTYAYNAAEEVTSVTAPDTGVTKYVYDLAGNLTTRTDPDTRVWTYGYDADNRLIKITDPLTNSVAYTYDGDGNQATIVDARGITATTSYDTDDRPTTTTYSDGTATVTYGYDSDDNVTSITDATGSRTLSHDADGNLTKVTGPASKSFSYGYNADGNVTSRVYPDGISLTYAYNTAALPAAMTDVSDGSARTTYAYDADGDLTSTVMPDGVTEARGYDNADQLTSITDTHGTTKIDADTLTLNADGEPAEAATVQNSVTQTPFYYSYDTAGRLASACQTTGAPSTCTTGTGGNETAWTYDKAGNMLAQASPSASTTYTYNNAEQLTKAVTGTTTTTYGYDLDGDLTTSGSNTYAYNGASEMSKAVTSAGTYTYTYDNDGNLAADSKSGTLQQTAVWDINNALPQVAEQTNAAGATTADLLYNPNATLEAITASGTTDHATTNWLGSVTGLVNSAGAQVSSTVYTPYGAPTTTGTPASPVGFAGSYAMPGAGGLDDMHARDYNPALGTFTSVDPMVAVTGQPYAYADDNPVSETDPSGACPSFLPCQILSNIANGAKAVGVAAWALAKEWNNTHGCGVSAFAAEDAGDTTQLFRHVDPNELEDVRATGQFRSAGNGMSGKFFAENAEDAATWGEWLNGGQGAVVEMEVPTSFADQLMGWSKLDGIGPARYVDESQLGEFNELMSGVSEVP